MFALFVHSFYALCILCAVLYLYTRTAVHSSDDAQFLSFQRSYLIVYLLAAGKSLFCLMVW